MIRIERGDETEKRRGVFEYHAADRVRWPRVCGESDQPLLDACRQLKSLYGVTAQAVHLFNRGSQVADITCSVEVGAATTVSDPEKGGGPRLARYREFRLAALVAPIDGAAAPAPAITPGD
jgi:hypothetical protein